MTGGYQLLKITWDIVAKPALTPLMCASAGKALHISGGTYAFYLFLITSGVKITNALTGAGDYVGSA